MRSATLPRAAQEKLKKEPMFCMETMIKCMYWSKLVYCKDRPDGEVGRLAQSRGRIHHSIEFFIFPFVNPYVPVLGS